MADEIVDRGDDFEALGDETGETVNDEVKDPVVKDPAVADPEVKDPVVPDPEVKAKDDGITIPKARFDQAVAKARAAEKAQQDRADKLEAELAASKGTVDYDKIESEIDKLEDDLEEAIKDGNVDAKVRIRKEIRVKSAQIAEARAVAHSQYATAVAVEQIRYDALVDRMEVEHPELNPDLEDTFDEEKVSEVMDYKSAFEAKGVSSSESLKKALKAVYGNAAPKPAAKKEEPAKEKDDAKGQEDLKAKADKLAADRKEAAIKAGLEAKGKQPSNEKAGVDSDKAGKSGKAVDIAKMSDKDFDKLDEDEKKKMRGDAA